MTREEAFAFKARYEAVNRVEIEELRSTSIESKLEQLNALMASARQIGWSEKLAEEADQVRERWARLRRILSRE
jgi:hypothetical protein